MKNVRVCPYCKGFPIWKSHELIFRNGHLFSTFTFHECKPCNGTGIQIFMLFEHSDKRNFSFRINHE